MWIQSDAQTTVHTAVIFPLLTGVRGEPVISQLSLPEVTKHSCLHASLLFSLKNRSERNWNTTNKFPESERERDLPSRRDCVSLSRLIKVMAAISSSWHLCLISISHCVLCVDACVMLAARGRMTVCTWQWWLQVGRKLKSGKQKGRAWKAQKDW